MNYLKERFTRSGVKLTHQRLEIFREVAISVDHPDAETICKGVRERVPTVSLDTVYRTLWSLLDLGIITTIGPPRGRMRFDANMGSHHHFICTKCGMTRDFCSKQFDQLKIPDTAKMLGRAEKTQVEVRGACLRCSKKKGK
ncbi:MAG: Fur family transcriptional regulator [Candidatus Eisenbacteria bacterium]|nr:Fur family transcriptional regulator [Candidatus Eisenbacteria bacterium]